MILQIHTDNLVFSEICRAYWRINDNNKFIETINVISKNNNMTMSDIFNIVKTNCLCLSSTLSCEICASSYRFKGRCDYLKKLPKTWICDDCNKKSIENEFNKKYSFILEIYQNRMSSPIDLYALSATQLVKLFAFAKFCADESLTYFHAFDSVCESNLTPNTNYSISILEDLFHAPIIGIRPLSNLNYIFNNENGGYSFNKTKVDFLLFHPRPTEFILDVERHIVSENFIDTNREELILLALEINIQECIFYLNYALNKHSLQYSLGKKTVSVIKKGLNKYSVSQMYNFIWSAAKNAAALYVRKRITKDHAAKSVVGYIDRQIDRASINGWDVFAFQRDYDFPQSILSRVLFNNVLKTDDGGFTNKISDLFPALDIN